MDIQNLDRPHVLGLGSLPNQFKIPPHSHEAEQAVLGGLMLDNQAWEQIADKILAEDFYRPEHQKIYQVMSILASAQTPLDVITVSEELQKLT